ncbi:hypothetical protein E1A91_A06G070500v1 [Gossypium mustelinum]|uniref:Uncharacterized protein n=1 Tax=Gossypium mustelinum TaxID=34275 RepID=A0A5D2YTD4_GOSMU|nr:hypothetical protein E1A91_A06G070500v1 [Gossypium mustelinum]TYJ29472.1 hypothetical protein E1A91_A06G070500v1 [Gossypium mustelinum]
MGFLPILQRYYKTKKNPFRKPIISSNMKNKIRDDQNKFHNFHRNSFSISVSQHCSSSLSSSCSASATAKSGTSFQINSDNSNLKLDRGKEKVSD